MKQGGAARYQRYADGVPERMGAVGRTAQRLRQTAAWPVLEPFFSFGVWVTALSVTGFTATVAMMMLPWRSWAEGHDKFGANGMGRCVALTGSHIEVTYDPGFDAKRPSMFCENHISVLDGFLACATIPHPFCGLMNHWHFHIPGYGWIMRMANGIPVFPRASGRTSEITAAAQERVARGLSILVFPEAHRTLDGNVRPFKRGVFFMARDAGIPVVNLAVRGLQDVNRKGQFKFTPGKIEVFIGPQIEVAGMTDDEITAVAEHCTRVAQTWVDGETPTDASYVREAA